MNRLFAAALAVAALCAAASAAPDDKVDRARLQKCPQLPSVGPRGWYYGITCDGRLFEGGEEENADTGAAEAASQAADAWATTAMKGDLVVMAALTKAAGRQFASLDAAYAWAGEERERSAAFDRKTLTSAVANYDEAVSLAERAGVTGRAASSVYVRRCRVLGLLDRCAPAGEPREERVRRNAQAAADHRRALECQADEPDAVTLLALDDAMGEPDEETGVRAVRSFEQLPDPVRAKIRVHVERLGAMATGTDAARAARALQGAAALHWFVRHDAAATETALKRSLVLDGGLRQSWNAFVVILVSAQRWDDLAKVCAAWIESEDGARQRMMLAKSLWAAGDADGAEKQWRAALALEPKSPATNVGVAVLVLRRAKTDADVTEARKLVGAASAALESGPGAADPGLAAACGLARAVVFGLSGEPDSCEKEARRLIEAYGEFPQAREVLAAIGR